MSELTVRLARVEIGHLVTLLQDAKHRGAYYGSKEQYWRRHERIVAKLYEAQAPKRHLQPSEADGVTEE